MWCISINCNVSVQFLTQLKGNTLHEITWNIQSSDEVTITMYDVPITCSREMTFVYISKQPKDTLNNNNNTISVYQSLSLEEAFVHFIQSPFVKATDN